MKLFLVGDFPEDDKTYGGVEGVLVNLANELSHLPDVELVLVSTSIDTGFKTFKDKCKTYNLNFRASFLKAKRKFEEIVSAEKPDIIHLQGVVPGVLLYKKKYRNIFVVTQHAILSEERLWQVSLKRKMLFRLKELIEKYYFKRIQNIIFISEYNQNLYLKNARRNKAVKYARIPNPVNKIFFQMYANPAFRKSHELYFVGEIKKRKGLHILLQALHILNRRGVYCKLHVIGGFKEKQYEGEIEHLLKSLQLSESVVFCGWKNQMEVIEYSKDIPVFVLPSFQETLPLSIAEAMSQGKIVVATDICGIPEMIENEVSGYLFSKGNFSELADVLQKVFENPDRQESISENAKVMSKRYLPTNVLDSTLDFYKSVLAAKLG